VTTPPLSDAWLVDDRWSKAYPLSAETHIGRGAGSSIILRDPVISRRHASVTKVSGNYVLNSFGSAGTRVNGVEIEAAHTLCEGDRIEIAFTSLRFTQMAPTGEMFIMARDIPTTIDQSESPTRATVKAAVIRKMPFWRRPAVVIAIVILTLLVLGFFAAGGKPE
jgi:pSer/pThr/pTyr-binding forkhead associated (FHA) protein